MKIVIDLGHGISSDTGAIGIIKEEYLINLVGNKVIEALRKKGHTVLTVRPTNAISVSNSLNKRVVASNNFNPEIYISIHGNAGRGKGTEIYTYNGNKVRAAINILSNMEKLGFVNRGIKDGSNLYVIRNTVSTAMLVEILFVDTKSDVDLFNYLGADKIALAIVNGIDNTKDNWISRLQKEINIQGFGNITVDGIAGLETLNSAPIIKQGSKGNITRLIQEKLNVTIDGIFGVNTKNAVELFQRNNSLVVDGIIGKNTWRKLLGL